MYRFIFSFIKCYNYQTIRILFYNDAGNCWDAVEPLALALSQDERFEVIVLAMPTDMLSGDCCDLNATQALREFSQKLAIPITYSLDSTSRIQCVVGFDSQLQPTLFPQDIMAHYCFMARPYDVRPHGWGNADIAKISKLCYIEYGIFNFSAHQELCDVVYNPKNLCYYDFIFAPTTFHQCVMQKQQESLGFTQILVVGSCRLEKIRNTDFFKQSNTTHKLTVCYMPRWNIHDSHSTFFVYKDLLWTLAREDKITLIWRPHPLMYDEYVKRQKILTQEQWDNLIATPNVVLDINPSYFDSFKKADVLISDTSSMLTYSFVSGKPTIYTQNIMSKEVNNWAAKWIYTGCFVINNADSLKELLENLQEEYHNTIAPLQNHHEKILNENFYFPQDGSVQRIIDILVTDRQNTITRSQKGE